MAALLDPEQPFYGLRASEVDGVLRRITVEELAARYIKDIRRVQPHGPYNLSGASFGGLVAYEMATQLAEQGEEIGVLALFDTGNPAHYRQLPAMKAVRFQTAYFVERFTKYGKELIEGNIWQASRDLWESLRVRMAYMLWRVAQNFYRVRHRPLPRALRDNVKIFNDVASSYTPGPYQGRMLLLRAAGRTAEYGNDPALGWDDVVKGHIEVRTVPGNHMTILDEPHVWNLVEQLSQFLEEVGGQNAPPPVKSN
jgi:thioesterase domain-containing protein